MKTHKTFAMMNTMCQHCFGFDFVSLSLDDPAQGFMVYLGLFFMREMSEIKG